MGINYIGSAAVALLETSKFYVATLDICTLAPNELSNESVILNFFHELKRHPFAAVYLPNVDIWWEKISISVKDILLEMLERSRLRSTLIIMTMECELEDFPLEIMALFPKSRKIDALSWNSEWRILERIESPSKVKSNLK
jgi:hypothetical protein